MMPFCLLQTTWHTGSPEEHFILKKDKELQSIWRAYFDGKGQYAGIKTFFMECVHLHNII